MKKLSLTLAAVVFAGLATMKAQSVTTTTPVNLADEVNELCVLTPDQVGKVNQIVANFVTLRDQTYAKYHRSPSMLSSAVAKNRWDYETNLIGVLNAEQMGLLKAFDQLNPQLMTCATCHVNKADYLAGR